MKGIILFDGECNLCNSSVQFILKRDPKGIFKFTSLQGKTGQSLLEKHGIKKDVNSFVLIEGDKLSLRSTAALKVCKNLNGPWKWLSILLVVPPLVRDPIYNFIAVNRYKWFGKNESCWLPSPKWKSRFLE
ncbi:thiol-disulfide oxidoreductase DCC family protein [Neobacillus cucumis]|uniref:Thiol-disulfide oxidoreductase n=1 Tax=Neobacillus cucumis TaxID=1740721 RepID=A0A2N5HVY8_9BACI|nr:thiol-disulfide oxidoreductase DCC family protein [Neobacillus cucumis]PLS09681.1 thiol-disulfide oxidoreductase [Neobacillus cucumis]